jgi:hypothetical protein
MVPSDGHANFSQQMKGAPNNSGDSGKCQMVNAANYPCSVQNQPVHLAIPFAPLLLSYTMLARAAANSNT